MENEITSQDFPEARRPVGRPRKDESIRSEMRSQPLRQRKRKGGQMSDIFHIDPSAIPTGLSYEWKRHTVYGKGDLSYDIKMREQGWLPVDASRHPELVPDGHTGAIIRDGLILMERPIELTQEALDEDRLLAKAAVDAKKQQLGQAPKGTMTRDHPGVRPVVRTTYESMPIDD